MDAKPISHDEPPTKLIALGQLPDEAPDWPWSPWATWSLIKKGELGCIKVGRRIFVTRELLEAFVDAHTVDARTA